MIAIYLCFCLGIHEMVGTHYEIFALCLLGILIWDCPLMGNMQMLRKLSKQLSGEDWTWNNLNTLCWAIGSISGSMMEEQVPLHTRLELT